MMIRVTEEELVVVVVVVCPQQKNFKQCYCIPVDMDVPSFSPKLTSYLTLLATYSPVWHPTPRYNKKNRDMFFRFLSWKSDFRQPKFDNIGWRDLKREGGDCLKMRRVGD